MHIPEWTRPIVRIMAFGVLLISLISVIGQVIQVEGLWKWAFEPGMAFNTAVALVLIALCILLMTRRET